MCSLKHVVLFPFPVFPMCTKLLWKTFTVLSAGMVYQSGHSGQGKDFTSHLSTGLMPFQWVLGHHPPLLFSLLSMYFTPFLRSNPISRALLAQLLSMYRLCQQASTSRYMWWLFRHKIWERRLLSQISLQQHIPNTLLLLNY